MRDPIRITKTKFHAAPAGRNERNFVGWIDFVINDSIGIDGVEVRRAQDGRLILVYPTRRDRGQREHYFVRPMDDATRIAIEKQVFDALAKDGRLSA